YAFVDATDTSTSRPSLVYRYESAFCTSAELRRLTIACTQAPRCRAMSTMRFVSVVVPLLGTAITIGSSRRRLVGKPHSPPALDHSTEIEVFPSARFIRWAMPKPDIDAVP